MDNELLKQLDPLIHKIANQFYNVDKEDLIQAGRIGLINAYKHYNSNSNTKFSTFAYSYIFGEMYNLSISNKTIKINRDILKLVKLIEKTKIFLTQSLGRLPNMKDIASYLEMDENILTNAYLSVNNVLSLDKESEEENNLYNTLYKEEDNDVKIDILDSVNTLSEEEQNIIKYRYYQDLTQSETAKIMGISQVKVSRYEQKSLKKLKKVMTYE